MIQNRPAPRWLVAFTAAVVLCALVTAAYIGWLAYHTRNTTPYEHDSEQYNGWQYAEMNQFKDARQCVDTDGGWTALGIETTQEFVSGCQQWFESR